MPATQTNVLPILLRPALQRPASGFNEAAAVFAQPSADEQRFSQSVDLDARFQFDRGHGQPSAGH